MWTGPIEQGIVVAVFLERGARLRGFPIICINPAARTYAPKKSPVLTKEIRDKRRSENRIPHFFFERLE